MEYSDENQKYNEFIQKFGIKAAELRCDYQCLSETNKRRFAQELSAFLRQQCIILTADQIIGFFSSIKR